MIVLLGLSLSSTAQIHYNNCSTTGTNASAIGNKTKAEGNNSFAGGYGSRTVGGNSFAFGYNCTTSGSTTTAIGNTAVTTSTGGMALGNYVKSAATNAFVFGAGTTANYPLTNSSAYSIAFGVNSNIPTMLITKSLNNNFTGKVAIGPVTTPLAKLHVMSDNNEDANFLIEVSNKTANKASISIFDKNHFIAVDQTANMNIRAEDGVLQLEGSHYCFGNKTEKKARLYTNGTPTLYVNAFRDGLSETREEKSASYAIGFNDNGIIFRTSEFNKDETPKGINWKNALYLLTDGKIGVGSQNTYLRNNNETLEINAPQALNMASDHIQLQGKIGINTVNDVTEYALAVNGGIISTKVYIKEVNQWPDYVFDDHYSLMDLKDLKHYLADHRHLPGIPSEKEVLGSGYDLCEMQSAMLQKIEELTRYILLLQDEIDELQHSDKSSMDSVVFSYDRNGNRTSRRLAFERIANPKHQDLFSAPSAYLLFPNPTYGKFKLQLNMSEKDVTLHATLLTISGTILETRETKGHSMDFDLTEQADGVYILDIDSPLGHESWKIIKE